MLALEAYETLQRRAVGLADIITEEHKNEAGIHDPVKAFCEKHLVSLHDEEFSRLVELELWRREKVKP